MLYLIDAMFYVRRELESDKSGRAPRKIINTMLATKAGDVNVWCWDGAGAKKRRQAIYPAYKTKRLPHPDNIWPLIALLKKALCHTPSIQITVPTYEGDDVIATMVRRYPDRPKHIRSNDRDLSQLFDGKTTADFTNPIKASEVRLYKTLVGDSSDTISGVKGFGEKAWDSMSPDIRKAFAAAFEAGDPRVVSMMAEHLPKAPANWLGVLSNAIEAVKMWQIIGLFTIPDAELNAGLVAGSPNWDAANAILQEFKH